MARKNTSKSKSTTTIPKIVKSKTATAALQHLEQVAAQHGLIAADCGDLVWRIGCSEYWGPSEQHLRGYELLDGASLSIHTWHNCGDNVAATIDVTAPAATMRTLLEIWAQRDIPANIACDELWLQRWAREQERVGARSRGRAPRMFVRGVPAREGKLEPNPFCDHGLSDEVAACAAIAWDEVADLEDRAQCVSTEQEELEDAKDDREKRVWADDLMEAYWHITRRAEQQAVHEIMTPVWDSYVAYKMAHGGEDYIDDMEDQEWWLDDLRGWYDRRAREEEQQARHDWRMLDDCTIFNAEEQRIPAQAIARAYSGSDDHMVSITITCGRHADAEGAALDLTRVMLQTMLPTRTQGTQLTLC